MFKQSHNLATSWGRPKIVHVPQRVFSRNFKIQGAMQPSSEKKTTDKFVKGLKTYLQGNVSNAIDLIQECLEVSPQDQLYVQVAKYMRSTYHKSLNEQAVSELYEQAQGFQAFINNGTNVPLYEETSKNLTSIHVKDIRTKDRDEIFKVLDIGVGDGRALIPCLSSYLPNYHGKVHVDLVEPSSSMLQECVEKLQQLALLHTNLTYTGHNIDIQSFASLNNSANWDLVQGTYSLQYVSVLNEDRKKLLAWLHKVCKHLVIVEFNVPLAYLQPVDSEERCTFLLETMAKGMQEYSHDENIYNLVCQGFLVPVFLSWFEDKPSGKSFEQPVSHWVHQLVDTGFEDVHIRSVYPYWWSTAWIIDARPCLSG